VLNQGALQQVPGRGSRIADRLNFPFVKGRNMSIITADRIEINAPTWIFWARSADFGSYFQDYANPAKWGLSSVGLVAKTWGQMVRFTHPAMAISVWVPGDPLYRMAATLDYTGVTIHPGEMAKTDSFEAAGISAKPPPEADVVLRTDSVLCTDGGSRVYSRYDAGGIRMYDAAADVRAHIGPGLATFERRTDADPDLWEFLQITHELLVIGTHRGGLPTLKCLFKSDGLLVIRESDTWPRVSLTLGIAEQRPARTESGIEAQEIRVGSGTLGSNGLQIRHGEKGSTLTEDGLVLINDVGVCRKVWIRWDGVYFFDASGSLLRKLTANGVEERSSMDPSVEANLQRTDSRDG
jgi:hypothetical protein